MDALISELKNGQVTLRRRQRPQDHHTNPALRELFEVLAQSQQQNRTSKTFLVNNKLAVFNAASQQSSPESELSGATAAISGDEHV